MKKLVGWDVMIMAVVRGVAFGCTAIISIAFQYVVLLHIFVFPALSDPSIISLSWVPLIIVAFVTVSLFPALSHLSNISSGWVPSIRVAFVTV